MTYSTSSPGNSYLKKINIGNNAFIALRFLEIFFFLFCVIFIRYFELFLALNSSSI